MDNNIICVTGGAGAIGCNLIRSLLKYNPKEIIILDNLSSGNKDFIPKDKRIKFHHVDISNREKLSSLIPLETDYIFHLAAHFANQNSVDYPISDEETNVRGIINLLEISKKLKLKKFVNCSSSCVYGNRKSLMSIDDSLYPFDTPYAINKFSKFYSEQYEIPTISIRIFNTYGPYEVGGKYRNVIPNFIGNALVNLPLEITGTGRETRDFTYVDDTCNLLILAATSNIAEGKVYNGGTGIETDILSLTSLIKKLCNSTSEIILKPRRDWDTVKSRVSDISRSTQDLGYIPLSTNLKQNLTKTINWYKNIL